ncbi:MAG: hypothetical protein ABJO36_14500 [Litorimonas sp.]
MKLKTIIFILFFGLFSTSAMAQNSDFRGSHSLGETDGHMGISSGVKLTIPFSAKNDSYKEKARFGWTLSVDSPSQRLLGGLSSAQSTNVLELGFFENGQPNMMLIGQNIYAPIFDPSQMRADSGEESVSPEKSKTILYVAGGALLLGGLTVAITSEAIDDLVNCDFSDGGNSPQCG